MRKKIFEINWKTAAIMLIVLSLFGCSDSTTPKSAYLISATNLTNNQPLSPPAFILHENEYAAWEIGTSASAGLEELAESGDPGPFLTEAADNMYVLAASQGDSVIGPGNSENVEIEVRRHSDMHLSFVSMLVNTNDAMAGVLDAAIGALGINESITLYGISYDAGTEKNSETAGSVPGPAAGGEGFNPERNDTGFVAAHSGVVTAADGLLTSVLDESHRWQNPVVRLIVTRTK